MKTIEKQGLGLAAIISFVLLLIGILSYKSSRSLTPLSSKDDTLMMEHTAIPIESSVPLRDSIVQFATSLLGTPYTTAGCSKNGFDCSGLVYYVFQHFRIQVPRSSAQFSTFGIEVPVAKARAGDIIVFLSPTRNEIGHLGIITNANGMESEFIHASSGHEMKVMISSLKQEAYARRFVKVVNVMAD